MLISSAVMIASLSRACVVNCWYLYSLCFKAIIVADMKTNVTRCG